MNNTTNSNDHLGNSNNNNKSRHGKIILSLPYVNLQLLIQLNIFKNLYDKHFS